MNTNPCIDEVSGNIIEDISGKFRLFRTTTLDGNVRFNLELVDDQNRVISFDCILGFPISRTLGKRIYRLADYLDNIER